MRKMNLAEGSLILIGFLLILNVLIVKMKGINLLAEIAVEPLVLLVVANTCFLVAFIVSIFGDREENNS